MNSLLDLDRELEKQSFEEKWNHGRYWLQVRLENGTLYPPTGEFFHRSNLAHVIEHCKDIRERRGLDYVVCDSENSFAVVYPETESAANE